MLLEVITYPHKSLFEKSLPVTDFGPELHAFLDDMYETMLHYKGIGLAAVQVNVLKQIFIINIPEPDCEPDKSKTLECINAKILLREGELFTYNEGCLSVPNFYEDVKRPGLVRLRYQDRFGKEQEIEADELLAVAIQHEFDHTQGKLFTQHIGFRARSEFNKMYKKGEISYEALERSRAAEEAKKKREK